MNNQQKELAINCLKELKVYKPYCDAFAKDGVVTLFERFAGFWINEDQEPELLEYIRQFEADTGSLVYAVTHECFSFGECYTLLCISPYDEDNTRVIKDLKDGYAWAWVWNKTCPICSEYGTVTIQSAFGGIRREY